MKDLITLQKEIFLGWSKGARKYPAKSFHRLSSWLLWQRYFVTSVSILYCLIWE